MYSVAGMYAFCRYQTETHSYFMSGLAGFGSGHSVT